jgi:lysophospholipase L1-like esterase
MHKRILCFGDSNTWGAIPLTEERYPPSIRWTGVLQRLLTHDWTVIEEGYNGRTSVWDDPIEGRLSGLAYFTPCLDSQAPLDLVVLMLGTNDTKERFGCCAETIAMGMQRLIKAVKAMNNASFPAPHVLLVSPILMSEEYMKAPLYGYFGSGCVEKTRGFTAAYEAIAMQEGCFFLDAAKVAEPSVKDGCHMEPESHAALGKAVYEKIREIFPAAF